MLDAMVVRPNWLYQEALRLAGEARGGLKMIYNPPQFIFRNFVDG